MPKQTSLHCLFNQSCSRLNHASHRPSIGHAPADGCPFSDVIVDLCFDKGDYLFHQGDKVRGGFSLTSGLAVAERVDEHGRRTMLRLLRPGAFVPCGDLFSGGEHGSSARAVTTVTACLVPSARLLAAVARPDLGMRLLRHGGAEAREHEDVIHRLCNADLGERVLVMLETLAEELGETDSSGATTFTLPVGWKDLAEMVGTGSEVISRLLRRLTAEGRLTHAGREVTLAPNGREVTLAPNGRGITLAPNGRGVTLAPNGRGVTLSPNGRVRRAVGWS